MQSLRERAKAKAHHTAYGFRNISGDSGKKPLLDICKWKLSHNPHQAEYHNETVRPVDIDWSKIKSDVNITYISHSSLLIQDHGFNILIDPVFFGLTPLIRNFTPLKSKLENIPNPDQILITHGHYDHLDRRSLKYFCDTQIITPLGYKSIIKLIGFKDHIELDWYDDYCSSQRSITLLPCRHWSMRNPIIGPNKSLWGSFLIRLSSGYIIYISGDSGYFSELSEIGSEYKIDLAIINLSAYEPRWFMQDSHINPAEALQMFKDLNAKQMLITHWGTFRLGNDPVHIPPIDLLKIMQQARLADRLIQLKHGQTLDITG